jgi:hypothetical protein
MGSKAAGLLAMAAAIVVMLTTAAGALAFPQGPWVLPAVSLSSRLQDASEPQLAASPDGTVTAVWTRYNGANTIIQAAIRPPGGSFEKPVNLSAPGQDASDPQVTASPDGTVTAVWGRSNGADDIIQAATRPPGGSFAGPVNLFKSPGNAFDPQLTVSPDGTVTAIWTRRNGANDIIQAATRPPGGSFGSPKTLFVDPGATGRRPQLAASPDGTVTAVWIRHGGANDIIQAATRPPGGAFGAPVDLSAPLQSAAQPQVTASPDGTVTTIWTRSNGANDIIQAATRPPGGAFGAPVDLSAPLHDAAYPQLAASPDGTVTAVWTRPDGNGEIVQAATRPPGGSFAAPVDLSSPGRNAYEPQLTASPDGTTTVVWERAGTVERIVQAATRPPGGSFAAPVDLSARFRDASYPQLAASPNGVVTAVWTQYQYNDNDDGGRSNTVIYAASTTQSPRARIGKVRVSGPAKVRWGKRVIYKVKITNSGGTQAKGVRLLITGRGIRFAGRVGGIAAGVTRTLEIKIKPQRTGKAMATFKVTSSNAGSETTVKEITVRRR